MEEKIATQYPRHILDSHYLDTRGPERENQEAAPLPIFLISLRNSGRDDWI
jgi:hypothetical protein